MFDALQKLLGLGGGGKGMTRDNRITNQMVASGRVPRNQAEVYPQRRGGGVNPAQLQQAAMRGAFTPGSQVPGLQILANPALRAQQSQQMQPFGGGYEDEYTPQAALEQTGYFNPQTGLHGNFIQSSQQDGQYPGGVYHPPNSGLSVQQSGRNPYRFRGL